ncbi:MAG: YfiR family protein [Candidatus Polarisedimenticolia bacterium]
MNTGPSRSPLRAALLLLALAAPTPAAGPALRAGVVPADPGSPSLELQVKAAFLYNFAKFAEWPDDAFRGPDAPLLIGVVGGDLFLEALERGVAGKTVGGRPFAVRRVRDPVADPVCHILFVAAGEARRLPRLLEQLGGAPVLLVGETPGFASEGGVINFFIEENRVRFEVNLTSAERARLRLSSKLLSLARLVGARPAAATGPVPLEERP